MKHRKLIALAGFVLAFLGCASPAPIARAGQSAASYFTGSGGSGMRLGILAPESNGLNENQAYLPRMVQGALVSNISRHSAISVLDRVSLDRVILETLDPTYEDNLDIVRLGHVAHVAYMMTGNITRTATGYVLQINVTDTTPHANTIASYSGIHVAARLNDFSAVNNASMELLEQMGVELTAAAVNRLTQASAARDIGAQTNLARGIVAQQRGTIVEALAHYHNAVFFDPRLAEATERLSTLSAHVSSGNIREDVRNEIQRRNEWLRILAEAEEFFSNNLPFELVYSGSLTRGRIDFTRDTVELRTSVSLRASSSFNAFNDILAGLGPMHRRREWGLQLWPGSPVSTTAQRGAAWPFWGEQYRYMVQRDNQWFDVNAGNRFSQTRAYINVDIALLNETGTVISSTNVKLRSRIFFPVEQNIHGHRLLNTTKLVPREDSSDAAFTVNTNDITDRLTIKIVSVNGVDVAQNPNFIRIKSR